MTALEVFARNRDLALDQAEAAEKSGLLSEMNRAYGAATAYAEAIRILEADVPFTCRHMFDTGQECDQEAVYLTPDGLRFCGFHAPVDVELTISAVTE